MKTVTFIKKHPCGIAAGKQFNFANAHADRLKAEGYVRIDGETKDSGPEPETIPYKLTKKDIQQGTYPGIPEDAKPGDEIQIPNPKFVSI